MSADSDLQSSLEGGLSSCTKHLAPLLCSAPALEGGLLGAWLLAGVGGAVSMSELVEDEGTEIGLSSVRGA